MTRSQRIGIVAVSAEGAALCYRTIALEGAALLGRHDHPEVSMHTYPLADYMRAIETDRWDTVGEMLLASAEKLIAAGAEILVCPDNTVHRGLDLIRDRTSVRWLHIAEEVGAAADARHLKLLGVLGTKYLMEGPVYPSRLELRGIGYKIPPTPERQRINEIIFDELVNGRITDESRGYFQDVIRGLAARGCDGVVLGCTEIPLLIAEQDSALPILDSTRTLARAALRAAVAPAVPSARPHDA